MAVRKTTGKTLLLFVYAHFGAEWCKAQWHLCCFVWILTVPEDTILCFGF